MTNYANYATETGTFRYIERFKHLAPGHFRQRYGLWLSSVGIGTYPGKADEVYLQQATFVNGMSFVKREKGHETLRTVATPIRTGYNILTAQWSQTNIRNVFILYSFIL